MENYDICIIAAPEDAAIAETLAGSIRAYRLPRGVALPNPELDYHSIFVDCRRVALISSREAVRSGATDAAVGRQRIPPSATSSSTRATISARCA